MPSKTSVLIIAALVAGLVVTECRRGRAVERQQEMALRADQVAAEADTTRALMLEGILGINRAWERRVLQQSVRADALDKALGRESRVRATLATQIVGLRKTAQTTTTSDPADDLRTASWHIRDLPYTVDATAQLTRLTGDLDIDIQLDSLFVGARVQCGDAIDGIRPATLLLTPPEWAPVKILEVQQDPAVCQAERGLPRPPRPFFSFDLSFGSIIKSGLSCGAAAGAANLLGLNAGQSLAVGASCAVVAIAF